MHDFVELILRLLQEAGVLAVLAVGLCVAGILIAYTIFRKVTKGEKKFPWGKVILLVLLVGYIVILLYATILRLHGGYRDMNLHLFRGWREAWNGFTMQLWLNVLLNVAMFIPLGILLPLLTKNYRKWYLVLAEGFGTSLLIEIVQYITARGLFDVDDLFNNTVRGYKAIVDGDTDILFCAGPSEEQKQYAEEQCVELIYVPVGLEGFVFFVNENNPVDSLTVDQIRDIYGGVYTNWKEVGGADRVINPVTRLAGSGSQSAMDSFMKGREIAPKSIFSVTGASIGFSFRYYMDGLVANDNVKMLALNGVYPSAENIRNGTYPIIAKFYAIYRADNTNPNIPVLIDWLLSDEGQTLIEESGYVRIN